jgi:hypothetical protein
MADLGIGMTGGVGLELSQQWVLGLLSQTNKNVSHSC